MAETSAGLLPFFPDLAYYIVGNHDPEDRCSDKLYGTMRNCKKFDGDVEKLFEELSEFDLIVHDSYNFSAGCRPEVYNMLPGTGCITDFPQWDKLKGFKLLIDNESVSGQLQWFLRKAEKFDGVMTPNPNMKGFFTHLGIYPRPYRDPGNEKTIDLLYSSYNIRLGYRGKLASIVDKIDRRTEVCEGFALPTPGWIKKLTEAKLYLATYSCPSGSLQPMAMKEKELKALLCGAMPITEKFDLADSYLPDGVGRVSFSNPGEIPEIVEHYCNNEEERRKIVEAGKRIVLSELTHEKAFQKCLTHYGFELRDPSESPFHTRCA
jgi:hypothetical protein